MQNSTAAGDNEADLLEGLTGMRIIRLQSERRLAEVALSIGFFPASEKMMPSNRWDAKSRGSFPPPNGGDQWLPGVCRSATDRVPWCEGMEVSQTPAGCAREAGRILRASLGRLVGRRELERFSTPLAKAGLDLHGWTITVRRVLSRPLAARATPRLLTHGICRALLRPSARVRATPDAVAKGW